MGPPGPYYPQGCFRDAASTLDTRKAGYNSTECGKHCGYPDTVGTVIIASVSQCACTPSVLQELNISSCQYNNGEYGGIPNQSIVIYRKNVFIPFPPTTSPPSNPSSSPSPSSEPQPQPSPSTAPSSPQSDPPSPKVSGTDLGPGQDPTNPILSQSQQIESLSSSSSNSVRSSVVIINSVTTTLYFTETQSPLVNPSSSGSGNGSNALLIGVLTAVAVVILCVVGLFVFLRTRSRSIKKDMARTPSPNLSTGLVASGAIALSTIVSRPTISTRSQDSLSTVDGDHLDREETLRRDDTIVALSSPPPRYPAYSSPSGATSVLFPQARSANVQEPISIATAGRPSSISKTALSSAPILATSHLKSAEKPSSVVVSSSVYAPSAMEWSKSQKAANQQQSTNDYLNWNCSQVSEALTASGVSAKYVRLLNDNGIDGLALLKVTEESLTSMGVETSAARDLILYAINYITGRRERGQVIVNPDDGLPQYE
ncbi:hypothetical protein HDU97_010034 [Phlyctochytrium planicorne]|nr:hypothetical protein HDU97_010034 [Phlyctochytrium planicorne]